MGLSTLYEKMLNFTSDEGVQIEKQTLELPFLIYQILQTI